MTVFPKVPEIPIQIPPRLQIRKTEQYEGKAKEIRNDGKIRMAQREEF
jgi:hypothetical protein